MNLRQRHTFIQHMNARQIAMHKRDIDRIWRWMERITDTLLLLGIAVLIAYAAIGG